MSDPTPTISNATNINVKLVIALCVAVAGAAVGWTRSSMQQAIIIDRLDRIEEALVSAATDRWPKASQSRWAHALARENPSIRVPDPDDPHDSIIPPENP